MHETQIIASLFNFLKDVRLKADYMINKLLTPTARRKPPDCLPQNICVTGTPPQPTVANSNTFISNPGHTDRVNCERNAS